MDMAHGTCVMAGGLVRQWGARLPSVTGIDTRLVAAVQTRAGARVHEAAGLLNGYYLWAKVLARAERLDDERMIQTALRQVRVAKVRLRQFLVGPAASPA